MQIKLNQISRRQHIFVFLTASGLSVVQFQRRFTGWVCLHSSNLVLAEASQDFSEILIKLRDTTADWKIPTATWVSWIMPGDILAVLQYCKPKDQVADISNLFPFESKDITLVLGQCRNYQLLQRPEYFYLWRTQSQLRVQGHAGRHQDSC
jgi:hypothetical protein